MDGYWNINSMNMKTFIHNGKRYTTTAKQWNRMIAELVKKNFKKTVFYAAKQLKHIKKVVRKNKGTACEWKKGKNLSIKKL